LTYGNRLIKKTAFKMKNEKIWMDFTQTLKFLSHKHGKTVS
jgi:hypothetical protein